VRGAAAKQNGNEFKTCLRLVLNARLQREGVIRIPVGVSGVENVTELARALELTELYLADTC